jgi:hypothetical protein
VKDSDFEPANDDFRTNCRLDRKITFSGEPKCSNERHFQSSFPQYKSGYRNALTESKS